MSFGELKERDNLQRGQVLIIAFDYNNLPILSFRLWIHISDFQLCFPIVIHQQNESHLERISHINSIQSRVAGFPMAIDVEYAHNRDVFNTLRVNEKKDLTVNNIQSLLAGSLMTIYVEYVHNWDVFQVPTALENTMEIDKR
jgi:hypothetical protein